jgi:uncharacterized protein
VNIPLFPLGTVLFPGGILPLQVFEVRYLDMVQRCHREGTPFGVVCLTQGHEVQQPDPGSGGFQHESFHSVGTFARIEALEQPRPGLLLIACEGTDRFRIAHSDRLRHGLWVADVTPLPADAPVQIPPELQGIARALRQLHERLRVEQPAAIAPWPDDREDGGPWHDAGWVANRWAELLPLPNETKQRLLTLDSPLLRLELVGDALEQLGIDH